MMNLNVAGNLKRLRKLRNLTQEDLADCIGVSFQSISKWECGNGYPEITMLPVLANFFDVTVDELIGMNEIKNQQAIEKTEDDVLEMTVEELNMTVRTFNCLKRAGIITVKDLVNKMEPDIIKIRSADTIKIRNLSKNSFEEVIQKLKSLGLSLKKEVQYNEI